MLCEASDDGMICRVEATRPVEDKLGFCSWRCDKHGNGLKTYKLYRPEPSPLDQVANAGNPNPWWHYAFAD